MRIDEFSYIDDTDGNLSSEEMTRFSCVGFDIISQQIIPSLWRDNISFVSSITRDLRFNGAIKRSLNSNGFFTYVLNFKSKIIKKIFLNSDL